MAVENYLIDPSRTEMQALGRELRGIVSNGMLYCWNIDEETHCGFADEKGIGLDRGKDIAVYIYPFTSEVRLSENIHWRDEDYEWAKDALTNVPQFKHFKKAA
jgi:hypothetical protein